MPVFVQTPETMHPIAGQDCDALGQLHNARYFDCFLNARAEHAAGPHRRLAQLAQAQQAAWSIAKHQISFLKPARQGATVRVLSQVIHFDNSCLVVEMQMRDEAGARLLALLWSKMAFVTTPGGTRADHGNALMDLLDELDVETVDYDPDGFDDRVKQVRQQLKKQRRGASY